MVVADRDRAVAFGGRETDFLSTLPFCCVGIFLMCVCMDCSVLKIRNRLAQS